jgi:hypothetical protein
VRTQLLVDLFVAAFAEEVQIDFAKCSHGLHGFLDR